MLLYRSVAVVPLRDRTINSVRVPSSISSILVRFARFVRFVDRLLRLIRGGADGVAGGGADGGYSSYGDDGDEGDSLGPGPTPDPIPTYYLQQFVGKSLCVPYVCTSFFSFISLLSFRLRSIPV